MFVLVLLNKSDIPFKEWTRESNKKLIFCNSKHSRKAKTQLHILQENIDPLKHEIKILRQTNEFLTNKIDSLTSRFQS